MLRTTQVSISDFILAYPHLALPTYQRDYTWEREHIEALFDDLDNAMDLYGNSTKNVKYFLGQIILCDDAPDGTRERTFIVDGQQRLISLAIIDAALRDHLKTGPVADRLDALLKSADGASPSGYRLDLRGEDDQLLKTYIQNRGAMLTRVPTSLKAKSETALSLVENRALVLKRIQQMTPAMRLQFATFLLDDCAVNVTVTDDVDYAFQIYLTLNNRGKRLAAEDILHGELIGPLADDERKRYADILESFSKYRKGLREPNKTTRKTFFSHLVSAIGGTPDQVVKPIRRAMREAGGASAFAVNVFRPMADAYRIVMPRSTERGNLSPRAQAALENLDWFEEHGNDDYLSSAMLAVIALPPDSDALARVLERIDWIAHTLAVASQGRKHRQKIFGDLNDKLRKVRANPATLEQIFATSPISQAQINKGVITLGRKMMETDKTFCRLVLLRIDAHLSRRSLSAYDPFLDIAKDDNGSLTVEHIVPKGNTIKEAYREDWLRDYPDDRHRLSVAQYLGNLALLTRQENNACDQMGFNAKKAILFGSRAPRKTHPIATTDELAAMVGFPEDVLMARHQRMLRAAYEIWGWGAPPQMQSPAKSPVTATVPAPVPKKRRPKTKA
jgi:hypothetical protein